MNIYLKSRQALFKLNTQSLSKFDAENFAANQKAWINFYAEIGPGIFEKKIDDREY